MQLFEKVSEAKADILGYEEELLLSLLRNDNINSHILELIKEIDFTRFLNVLIEQGFLMLVKDKIIEYVPEKYKYLYEESYYIFENQNKLFSNELKRIKREFNKLDCEFILCKGFSIATRIYENPYQRYQGDMDVLVNWSDHDIARKVFDNLGYGMIIKKTNTTTKEGVHHIGYNFHEACYGKKQKFSDRFLKLELHRNFGCIPIKYMKDFEKNLEYIKIDNEEYPTFDIYHQFLHLCVNTYENLESYHGAVNRKALRDLYEVYVYCKKYDLDYQKIKSLSFEYNMMHQLRCVFEYVNIVFSDFKEKVDINLFSASNVGYRNGMFLDWNKSIYERLFEPRELRAKNYKKLYKKRCLSEINPNYSTPYIISKTKKEGDEWTFLNNEHSWDIKYKIIIEKNQAMFRINIPVVMLNLYCQVQIGFIDENEESTSLMSYVSVGGNNLKLERWLQENINNISYENIGERCNINIKIPLELFNILNKEVCFNVLVMQYICDDLICCDGGQFGLDSYSEGELGVIRIVE